jgi:hypothetical protein
MGKNYLKLISSFLLSALLMIGCQKDLKETNPEVSPEANLQTAKEQPKNECRLTKMTWSGVNEYNYHYNNEGLADEWDISDYGLFKQEYDANGKLAKSRWYIGNDLQVTIHFFYEGKKVIKEIWYNGNTTEIGDEVFYTYNAKGQMVRMESFLNDYYTIMSYTPQGNNSSWDFFVGGYPYYSGVLKYIQPYKNPYLAVPGIEHGFPYVNPQYNSNKWWATSEKQIIYDENGDPIVLFDYDPLQTIWQAGHQNYPLSSTYYDLISETWVPYIFEYENCGSGNVNNNSRKAQPSSVKNSRKINPVMLIKYNPSKSIKEQARDLRRQLIK